MEKYFIGIVGQVDMIRRDRDGVISGCNFFGVARAGGPQGRKRSNDRQKGGLVRDELAPNYSQT